MGFEEIVVIVLAVSFVCFIFGKEIYKRIKKMPSSECSCCKSNMNRALKEAKKAVSCQCNKNQ